MLAVSEPVALRLPSLRVTVAKGKPYRHWHSKQLVLTKPMYSTDKKVGHKTWEAGSRRVRLGFWCPVCGFHPNETAKDMTRQAMETIAAKKP